MKHRYHLNVVFQFVLGYYFFEVIEMKDKVDKGYSGTSSLSVRVSGPEMQASKGYDLDSVIGALQDSQALIRKTYLTSQGRVRFTSKDYDNFQIKLKEWREGSLWSDLELVYSSVILPTIPFVVDNREFIWESIKDSYTFLKAKLTAKSKGEAVKVEQKAGEHGVNITNNGSGTVIVAGPGLPDFAESIKPYIQQLTENIQPNRVDTIEVTKDPTSTAPEDKVVLDSSDKKIFGETTLTSDDRVSISGKITALNYVTNSGNIEITSSSVEAIKPGHVYHLKISTDLHAEDKAREMYLRDRPYYCKYTVSAQNPNRVMEITITDWDDIEWDQQDKN
ncbi:hypothetical protein EFO71_06735 [Lacticaseibacillus rhamnosus]|nr:hypothetical protein [Lacticaseibacillus rhamnosus]MCT3178459.1 hypothetical protein [Lacticaseibacillus rhamnosus]MCT3183919.1 hypothetical protein [Lacticaseibacillus rhamnosus]MCT4449549.1 hypothetical protein [Lacticaseibacillus rhamnosus]